LSVKDADPLVLWHDDVLQVSFFLAFFHLRESKSGVIMADAEKTAFSFGLIPPGTVAFPTGEADAVVTKQEGI